MQSVEQCAQIMPLLFCSSSIGTRYGTINEGSSPDTSEGYRLQTRQSALLELVTDLKSLFGKSWMSVSSGEIGAHGDEDHGL